MTPSRLKRLHGILHFPSFLVLLVVLVSFSPSIVEEAIQGVQLVTLEETLLVSLSRLVLVQGGYAFPLTSFLLLAFTITAPSSRKFIISTIVFLFFVHFFFYYFLFRMVPGSLESLSINISLGVALVCIAVTGFGVVPGLLASRVRLSLQQRRSSRAGATFTPRACERCGAAFPSSARLCSRCGGETGPVNGLNSRT